MVNQSSLTGESVAVTKSHGSTVYAGTVIEAGEIIYSVESNKGHNRIDEVIRLIDESEKINLNIRF